MKRTFAVLSILALALTMTTSAFGEAQQGAQAKAEHLSKQQLTTLIANAKTPAEHERIAQFYVAKAQDYTAQANMHEAMIAAYKANSSLSNDKNWAATIGHCEYFAQTLKEKAVKSQELAELHAQMARSAEQK